MISPAVRSSYSTKEVGYAILRVNTDGCLTECSVLTRKNEVGFSLCVTKTFYVMLKYCIVHFVQSSYTLV